MRTPSPPKLTLHKTGVYKVRFRGRDRYFSKDANESARRYASWIQTVWAPAVQQRRRIELNRPRDDLRICHLAELFLMHTADDASHALMAYYRRNLSEFLHVYGDVPIERFTVRELADFKAAIMTIGPPHTLSPKTVGHRLGAVKRLFRWGYDMGHVREVNLRGVRAPRLPRPDPRILSPTEVLAMIDRAEQGFHLGARVTETKRMERLPPGETRWVDGDPRLGPWLRVMYLAVLRPSELLKLMRGDGYWVEEGVFMLRLSKCDHAGQADAVRHVILSDRAMRAMAAADRSPPPWTDRAAFSFQVRRRTWPHVPKQLRASAASHLAMLGVVEGDIRMILGHTLRGATAHYVRPPFERLRREAGRLVA